MTDLNDIEQIKALDPKNVYESTRLLTSQCRDILELEKLLNFPNSYTGFENILICGMGGSAYGGHVALSLFKEEVILPILVNSDYKIPRFVNDKTLVILTSYSGGTEEILANANDAKDKGAKIVVLTTGGELANFAKENNLPSVIFNPKNNPANQPRLGTGYIVLGTISILKSLGLVSITNPKEAIDSIENEQANIESLAKDVAQKIVNKTPLIFASEFLDGNAHIMRNQINETAKSFSSYHLIPELNHHLMEGLKYPDSFKSVALMLTSSLYRNQNQKRFKLTREVVEKNNIEVIEVPIPGDNKFHQMLYLLSFGGYLSLFMGLLYNEDPSLIPWVDYFKENLNK